MLNLPFTPRFCWGARLGWVLSHAGHSGAATASPGTPEEGDELLVCCSSTVLLGSAQISVNPCSI